MVLVLVTALRSETIRELPQLITPSIIDCDGERIFILDGVAVYVYSQKDFQLIAKFGKRGEGPGELMTQPDLPIYMQLYEDQVLLNSFNKLIYFSNEGKFIKKMKIPFLASQIIPLKKVFAVSKCNRRNDGSSIMTVFLADENLNQVKEIYQTELLNDQGRRKIAWPLLNIQIQEDGERLYVFDQQKGFQVDVYNHSGEKISEIKKNYEKIRITEDYKKKIMDWLKLQPAFRSAPEEIKKMIYFLDYFPVMDHCLVRNQRIYIQTYLRQDPHVEFIVLDVTGKELKKMFLFNAKPESVRLSPGAGYTFHGDRFYYLAENDDEEWELHIQKIQ